MTSAVLTSDSQLHFCLRNQVTNASARKINQMLNQEEPCTIEDLLEEEEGCISMCRAATPKLIEFVCDKEVLAKLIAYAC